LIVEFGRRLLKVLRFGGLNQGQYGSAPSLPKGASQNLQDFIGRRLLIAEPAY
jgi:hypothetical protein